MDRQPARMLGDRRPPAVAGLKDAHGMVRLLADDRHRMSAGHETIGEGTDPVLGRARLGPEVL
jgi:hypothetical protein